MASPHRVVWTDEGRRDLIALFDYLVDRSPLAAERITRAIVERVRRLDQFPRRGRLLSRSGSVERREVFVQPFRIIYEVADVEVRIMAVTHGSRDIEAILDSLQ